MYYPESVSSKEMSDRVHTYVNRVKRWGNTYSNQCLFESIREILIEFTYYVPQTRLGLAEEDSSDFVLYVLESLETILLKYRPEANDFYSYYCAVLDNKIKSFYRNRRINYFKEKSAVKAQSLFDVSMFPISTNFNNYSVSENSASACKTKMAQKLRFLALKSKTTQRRLFVYIISISPFTSISTIKDLCVLFEIDWNQTNKLILYIENHHSESIDYYNDLTVRRNRMYCRSLELEHEINIHSFFCDYNKANTKLDRLLKLRQELCNKNTQLRRANLHINYTTLSKILQTTKQAVASSAFYSKNLISWCNDFSSIESSNKTLGLPQDLIDKILTGKWEKEKVRVTHLSVFYPEHTFSINYKLNV